MLFLSRSFRHACNLSLARCASCHYKVFIGLTRTLREKTKSDADEHLSTSKTASGSLANSPRDSLPPYAIMLPSAIFPPMNCSDPPCALPCFALRAFMLALHAFMLALHAFMLALRAPRVPPRPGTRARFVSDFGGFSHKRTICLRII